MPTGTAVPVVGLGAVSPVGLSAPSSCAALRAGIARLKALATYVVDGEIYAKEPVVGGRVPTEWLHGPPEESDWSGHDRFRAPHPPERDELVAPGIARLIEIALPAAHEAWEDAGFATIRPSEWALYLGCGEEDDPEVLAEEIVGAIGVGPAAVRTNRAGRAAGLVALRDAVEDLRAKRFTYALVGGVDSQIRTEALARLDSASVLKSASNPQGVVPGEAAAFLALAAPGSGARGRAAYGFVLGAGCADEPTAASGEPNRAEGLCAAIRQARSGAPDLAEKPLVVCDLNGERYRGLEWTLALVRSLSDLPGEDALWHPADCIGDAGAGLGAFDLVWAVTAMHRGYAGRDRVLVWGASDRGVRAAALFGAAGVAGGS